MKNSDRRKRLFVEQDGKCYYCEGDTCMQSYIDNDPLLFTLEHLQRKADGGSDGMGNIVGACYRCNTHRDVIPSDVWKIICKDILAIKAMTKTLKRKSKRRIKRINEGKSTEERVEAFRERDATIMPLIMKKQADSIEKLYAEHWPEGLAELEEVREKRIALREANELLVSYGFYKLPNDEQATMYRNKAYFWFANKNPAKMFTDCRSASVNAVMEYIANEDGYTMFKSAEGREILEKAV